MFLRLARSITSPKQLSRLLVFVLVGFMLAATAPRFGHDAPAGGATAHPALQQASVVSDAPKAPLLGDEVEDDRGAFEDDHADPTLLMPTYGFDLHIIAGVRPLSSNAILADAPLGTELRPPIG